MVDGVLLILTALAIFGLGVFAGFLATLPRPTVIDLVCLYCQHEIPHTPETEARHAPLHPPPIPDPVSLRRN